MTRATIFEEHSQVLAHWFGQDARDATLVYLDAHLDLQFIEPQRIARLAACTSAAEVAALESTHCLSPDRSACYGIEDFLYPAARLGLLRRVVWVAPPHVIKGGMAGALHGLQQMEGVTMDDLESFRRHSSGVIEGRLLGVDLAICLLEQLPALHLEGELLVDIDADYFVVVPGDTVWAEPKAIVSALKLVAGAEANVTIARSVSSGFMPLRQRFLADHVAALWEGRRADAQHWQRLLDLERQPSPAGSADLAAARPACAATVHALALATPEGGQREALLAKAAMLDPAYADDLLRRLCQYRARRIRLDLNTLLALQREVQAARTSDDRQAVAWIALGLLFTAFERLQDAVACDAQSREGSHGHPELALELARLHIARSQFDAAMPFLRRAAGDDETRVGAWLQQGECAHAARDHDGAGRAAAKAMHAAPAWPLVLERMAVYAHAGGDTAQAEVWTMQRSQLEGRLIRLARRL